ncbi:MAG TPA: DUF664 domain-containing protein [Jatrophihabitans sp.]|jgi:hypothetical protein|uniref:mycothiol transferase n=1 Tax=Jatrophihabitans sp. TaxID=1932789 RepID=UPI002DFE3437|nr:DUF664 domain-containing protein [Jatrophihabitans sp.]
MMAMNVSVSADDYLYFVGRALGGMDAIVRELGDARAGERASLPGANSPYGLLTHCLGVVEYWAGHLVAGRTIERDRATEFDATGPVDDLLARSAAVFAQLRIDVVGSSPAAPLRHEPDGWAVGPDRPLTQGAALLHVYEELAQHHGQMEILHDAVRDSAR